jgi:hypothetical protein
LPSLLPPGYKPLTGAELFAVVILIHADCWLFVFTSAVLRYIIDYNEHSLACGSAIHMCIFFFISNKMLVSLFLVERAHVVLSRGARRLKSRLYVVNLTVVLLIYASCFSTFWPFHFNQIQGGLCFSGLKRAVLTTYIVADGVTNVYLTTLFLLPVIRSHSFGRGWRSGVWDERVPQLNSGLRELALRTFTGSLLSLGSITANMVIFTVLQVEPVWLCISTCQGDRECGLKSFPVPPLALAPFSNQQHEPGSALHIHHHSLDRAGRPLSPQRQQASIPTVKPARVARYQHAFPQYQPGDKVIAAGSAIIRGRVLWDRIGRDARCRRLPL